MELFHKVVLGFAIVILILILVSLGLLLDEQQKRYISSNCSVSRLLD